MMKLSYACKNLTADNEEPLYEPEPYIPSTSVETSTSVQVPPVYTELQPSPHILRTVPVSNFTAGISEIGFNPGMLTKLASKRTARPNRYLFFGFFRFEFLYFECTSIMD